MAERIKKKRLFVLNKRSNKRTRAKYFLVVGDFPILKTIIELYITKMFQMLTKILSDSLVGKMYLVPLLFLVVIEIWCLAITIILADFYFTPNMLHFPLS